MKSATTVVWRFTSTGRAITGRRCWRTSGPSCTSRSWAWRRSRSRWCRSSCRAPRTSRACSRPCKRCWCRSVRTGRCRNRACRRSRRRRCRNWSRRWCTSF